MSDLIIYPLEGHQISHYLILEIQRHNFPLFQPQVKAQVCIRNTAIRLTVFTSGSKNINNSSSSIFFQFSHFSCQRHHVHCSITHNQNINRAEDKSSKLRDDSEERKPKTSRFASPSEIFLEFPFSQSQLALFSV